MQLHWTKIDVSRYIKHFAAIKLQREKKKLYSTKRLTLWKPGSMLSESTTTTGDSLPVIHISPFHIMRADVSIKPERDHPKKKKRATVRTSSSKQKLYNIGCALNIMYNQRIFHKKTENHIPPPYFCCDIIVAD